MRSMSTDYASA